MAASTTTELPHNVSASTKEADLLLDIVISIQVTIASLGIFFNSLLLYGQIKSSNWPFYQRLLFINVTAAAAASGFIHAGQGSYQLWKHVAGGNGSLEGGQEVSDLVADAAQVAVVVSMDILAFQNFYALRQCDKQVHSRTLNETSRSKRIALITALIILIWIVAAGFVIVGLNPQAQVYASDERGNVMSYASWFIGLTMELSVGCTIYVTHKTVRRLETDFAIRRAQQNLAVRVHINRTMNLTTAISRVLTLHVTVWVTSLSTAFGLNRYLKSLASETQEDTEENLTAGFTAVVDVLALSFDFLYPLVVCCKQPQLQRQMGLVLACKTCNTKVGPDPQPIKAVIPSVQVAPRGSTGRAHFGAIENLWERVADSKITKVPAAHNAAKVKTATLKFHGAPGTRRAN